MKVIIHLVGSAEDFGPKIDKLQPEDRVWLDAKFLGKKHRKLVMNLDEIIKFLTMFNKVEQIYFEVE